MKQIKFLGLAALCGCMVACQTNKKQDETVATVHLKGQLVNVGKDFVRMSYNGAASLLGDSRDIMLQIDSEGNVDTTIVLTEPSYFSIGRNTLYLTPGDDLTFRISDKSTEAEFQGKGAEANTYMKDRLFPKSGSFLQAGENVKEDLTSTMKVVDSLAQMRMLKLEALTNVSDEFKKLETARIKADVVNSWIYYANYSGLFAEVKNRDEMMVKWDEFTTSIAPQISPKIQELLSEELLDVAVVRDVLSNQLDSTLNEKWFKGATLPVRTQELFASSKLINELRMGDVSEEALEKARTFLQTVQNKDFATEVEAKITQNMRLLPGQPAIDLELTDVAGNAKKLSDFKGKLIYVDLWATWCGPCLQEAPFFEKVSQKYAGKDIVFVPISTDRTREPWLAFLKEHKKELEQFHSTDVAMKDGWLLYGIPRFILINKDFNIINAFAPRPSEEETTALIDSLLAK
ncbi:TlpA disulfide reductase family protein [Tannerella sp.]|uniref:TlpA family protein disulfide reductase n=1 Tax=Tannerella sp. TaxID=2382127 RepID=UPI0026DC27E2|nr:TlpA disulfide reductase family protein [Tannerella sp.]MDO4702982.1 TlpA disulfide reductase family protein [Tannerella sp.]